MREHSSSTRGKLRRFIASFSVLAVAGFSLAHAAVTQVVVRPYSSADRRLVADVAFDAPVCLAAQNSGTLPQFQPSATDILQSRVSCSTVSIVLDISAPTTTCITSSVLTVFVPLLAPGGYTLRVADSKRLFTGNVYGNNVVQGAVSTTFTVASPGLPTTIPVFVQQGKVGTELSTYDAGTYQSFPTYASDTGRWQPVFYAWPWGSFEINADELRRVFKLATRIPSLPERFLYTIDDRERDALVATGAFVDVATGSNAAVFAAIPAAGGICPTGRVPIYRAFEPKAVIHRYVPAATYSLLLANGWIGDGIAFCVASEPAGASSWAPN
jgi:hypothetical protein